MRQEVTLSWLKADTLIRQPNIFDCFTEALFIIIFHSLFSLCFSLCYFLLMDLQVYWSFFFTNVKSVISSTQRMFHFTYCIFMYRNFIFSILSFSFSFMFMFYFKPLFILGIFIIAVWTFFLHHLCVILLNDFLWLWVTFLFHISVNFYWLLELVNFSLWVGRFWLICCCCV